MSYSDEMLEREFKEKCKKHLLDKRDKELRDLRDHFAGLAMQQFLTGARLPENYDAVDEFRMCSERAYEMADAMLKQRSLTND